MVTTAMWKRHELTTTDDNLPLFMFFGLGDALIKVLMLMKIVMQVGAKIYRKHLVVGWLID
jgi:hypothetical protein